MPKIEPSPFVTDRTVLLERDIAEWADDFVSAREALYAIEEAEARPARIAFHQWWVDYFADHE